MAERAVPRIAPLPSEEWTDPAREVFAYWEGEEAYRNGSRSNTMMTLAHHPRLAIASLDLGRYFMQDSGLTARQIKMLILRVASRYKSQYQWAHNALAARGLGFTDAQIESLRFVAEARRGAEHWPELWDAADNVFLQAVDAVGDGGRLSDELWVQLCATFDRRTAMDLIHAVGYFTMVAWGLVAMGVEVEPDFLEFSTDRAKSA